MIDRIFLVVGTISLLVGLGGCTAESSPLSTDDNELDSHESERSDQRSDETAPLVTVDTNQVDAKMTLGMDEYGCIRISNHGWCPTMYYPMP